MTRSPFTPVAVIGMSCRLPGGIDSPEQLWEALLRGDDLVTDVPRDRWDAEGVPGRTATKWGAFLDDIYGFDSEFFGIDDDAASALDPQHRLLLETSWEAMEHAGLRPAALADSPTGVFVGLSHIDYQLVNADSDAMAGPHGFDGNTLGMASGRIARALGVRGPALTLDTACSSGLTAVHMACRSLNDGESALAFAGGAFVMLEPRKFVSGTAQSALSPTGRCHAFDADADGYVPGEAVAVVVLKRLPDAQRDGDRILAVIRGTAVNHDGTTDDRSTPSARAQTALYRAALETAGVAADTIGMVEAHGPGTPDGDPIEYAGLAEVYGTAGPCALGSVKTNVGHAQSASGLLGLLKTVLALQHGAVPQNLHFTRLPDAVARIETNLFVPQHLSEWPGTEHPRRAAVSSYGTSGTNVHAVLEQAPEPGPAVPSPTDARTPLVFPLSSTSATELRRTAGRLADWIEAHEQVALPDLGYTLARRRAHRPVRTAVQAGDRTELITALRGIAEGHADFRPAVGGDDRGPVWVFSGQDAQWSRMGAELLTVEPVFAATVAQIEPLVAAESGFSVTAVITGRDGSAGYDRIQPAVFTIQIAAAAVLAELGAVPGAVIGHSTGEIAAAVVAGALSLEDGVRVVCRSARMMATVAGSGAVASVELPAKQVLSELTMRSAKDAAIAVVAAPQTTVIAGARTRVHEMVADWQDRGIAVREIPVDVAANSPQLDPIVKELTAALADIEPRTPSLPFYSATGFDPREQPRCDGRYWVQALRRTVRFAAAVRAAMEDGYRVFAELAPQQLLADAIEETARSLDVPLATMAGPGEAGPAGFLAALHSAGAAVDFAVPYPSGALVDVPLPTWTHRTLRLGGDVEQDATVGGYSVAAHPLLGPHVRLTQQPQRYVWQAEVGTSAQPWLAEHRVHDVAVLPAAAYCEMALTAARVALGEAAEVSDLELIRPLPLDGHTTVGASTTLSAPGVAGFVAESGHDGDHARHATAVLRVAEAVTPPRYDVNALLAAHPESADGAEVSAGLGQLGVHHGSAFAALGTVHVGRDAAGSVLAELAAPDQLRSQLATFGVHPALLEACFQSVAASPHVDALGDQALGRPVGVQRLRLYGSARDARYCYTRVTTVDGDGVQADLDVLDRDGAVLLSVHGLTFDTGAADSTRRDRILDERLMSIDWQQRTLPDSADATGAWLLVSTGATADVTAAALADSLKNRAAQCTTMCWPAQADHVANAEELARHLRDRQLAGVAILAGPTTGGDIAQCPSVALEYAQHLVRIAREVPKCEGRLPHLVVVTRDAQPVLPEDVPNLEHGALRGLVRVIGAEYPHLRVTQIDVDEATGTDLVAAQLLGESDEDETAWRGGAWYTARLRPAPLRPDERQTTLAHHDSDGMRLQIRTPGDLETLELVSCERIPPGPGQIEVAVHASGINFADVLVAMGRFPGIDGEMPELGMDFAGVVTSVGSGVTEHRIGDRVGGFSPSGCWGTFVSCDARLAVPLPTGLSDHQAVAVATATATAWHGLHDQARITAADKVLIHSATGGVGQAAIAIARAAGAEIFATAGSDERRNLLRSMGIEYVYDSRSVDFAEQIRQDTGGYGVDIVLNSLTGAAQRAGIELLAVGGRFVEIGKRDVYGNSQLDLFPFRRNLTFSYVDLALMSLHQPQRAGNLLRTVYRLVADGDLPPAQHTDYPLTDAAVAIREMGAARHTGKLILEVPRTGHSEAVTPPAHAPVFRADGAYLITGGLSDLGLFLAEKMSDAGCGRIVLTSRSQPTLKALETIEMIRVMGGDVVVHCGDIADPATAVRLVETATATGLPVRGVLHAAATVAEVTVAKLTDDVIEQDWAPKVYGAWNLHTATAGQPLDWFCTFSSAAALIGAPGRAAYAAANSWLDAFGRWRRAQGQPATVIAWGSWDRIGRGSEPSGADITADEGAYAFEMLLRHDRTYSGYVPVSGTSWPAGPTQRSPFAEAYRAADNGSGTDKLRAVLGDAAPQEWPALLRKLIAEQISLVLRRNVDPDRPLAEYGVDSLGALELRTRLEAETGIRLASSELAVGTIRGLAELLCDKLAPTQENDESPL